MSSKVKKRSHIFEHFQVLKNYLLFGKIASAEYIWNEEVENAIHFMERDIFGYYRTVANFVDFIRLWADVFSINMARIFNILRLLAVF